MNYFYFCYLKKKSIIQEEKQNLPFLKEVNQGIVER